MRRISYYPHSYENFFRVLFAALARPLQFRDSLICVENSPLGFWEPFFLFLSYLYRFLSCLRLSITTILDDQRISYDAEEVTRLLQEIPAPQLGDLNRPRDLCPQESEADEKSLNQDAEQSPSRLPTLRTLRRSQQDLWRVFGCLEEIFEMMVHFVYHRSSLFDQYLAKRRLGMMPDGELITMEVRERGREREKDRERETGRVRKREKERERVRERKREREREKERVRERERKWERERVRICICCSRPVTKGWNTKSSFAFLLFHRWAFTTLIMDLVQKIERKSNEERKKEQENILCQRFLGSLGYETYTVCDLTTQKRTFVYHVLIFAFSNHDSNQKTQPLFTNQWRIQDLSHGGGGGGAWNSKGPKLVIAMRSRRGPAPPPPCRGSGACSPGKFWKLRCADMHFSLFWGIISEKSESEFAR